MAGFKHTMKKTVLGTGKQNPYPKPDLARFKKPPRIKKQKKI